MTQMQGLFLYNEYLEIFEKLPSDDMKNLVINAMHYNRGEDVTDLTPIAELIWPVIASKIDHMRASYERRCQANREKAEKHKQKMQDEQETQVHRKSAKHGTEARGDVYFSEQKEEHMNCEASDDGESAQAKSEHTGTDDNACQTTSNDSKQSQMRSNAAHHAVTITKTETETKTKTETETKAETITETETQTKAKAQAKAQAKVQAKAETETEARLYPASDGGRDGDCGGDGGMGGVKKSNFLKPTVDEVRAYCRQYALLVDADRFYRYYEERGWQVRGEPIKSWRAMADHWQKLGEQQRNGKPGSTAQPQDASGTGTSYDLDAFVQAAMERDFDWEG
ncbi:MAG: hypothetical protein IJW77_13020 [Clostridia bacterium]|nr:hypothetical protein [Clostridia bacterium]